VQGRSLLPEIAGTAAARRAVYSEFRTIKAVRTKDWKLVHYVHAPHGELYDLREDPHELRNLYGEPRYARVRAEMKSLLLDWMIESQDPALAPVKAG
jgi:arylsulfatase A-like enzyme